MSGGDLYIVAEIELPTQVEAKEKELWEQLSRASSFNPARMTARQP